MVWSYRAVGERNVLLVVVACAIGTALKHVTFHHHQEWPRKNFAWKFAQASAMQQKFLVKKVIWLGKKPG